MLPSAMVVAVLNSSLLHVLPHSRLNEPPFPPDSPGRNSSGGGTGGGGTSGRWMDAARVSERCHSRGTVGNVDAVSDVVPSLRDIGLLARRFVRVCHPTDDLRRFSGSGSGRCSRGNVQEAAQQVWVVDT